MLKSPAVECMPGKPTHISFPPQFYDIFINCLKDAIELAKSEILNDGSRAIAPELSETASRPLISEKSPEARKEAIRHSVRSPTAGCTPGKPPSAP